MNLTVMGILVGFAAYAASATLNVDSGEKTKDIDTVKTTIVETIDISNRKDIEFFLIDPYEFQDEFCLAQNIFFESSIDNKAGMAAVADVVLNRVKHAHYPDSICGVVYQAKMKESWKTKQYPDLDDSERVYIPIRHRCQFSWFCDGKSDEPPIGDEWRQAQTIAYRMVNSDYLIGIADGATHYHATYVNPKWNKDMLLIGRIGLHIFYVQR
jgi:hypothetical protein